MSKTEEEKEEEWKWLIGKVKQRNYKKKLTEEDENKRWRSDIQGETNKTRDAESEKRKECKCLRL